MSERGAISPERDEIVDERGAEMSGAVCCDFERWSEHPRERGAGILTAQLRSHALALGCNSYQVFHCVCTFVVGKGLYALIKFDGLSVRISKQSTIIATCFPKASKN